MYFQTGTLASKIGVVMDLLSTLGLVDHTGLTLHFSTNPSYFKVGLVSLSKFVARLHKLDLALGSECKAVYRRPQIDYLRSLHPAS